MLSVPHMIVVFVIVLVVFGPQKLPELARGLGKLMAEFRKASTDFKSAFEEEMRDLERQAREVERRKAETASSAAAAQTQSETPATPSGAETQAGGGESAAPGATEDGIAGAGEGPVVAPVAEGNVAREPEMLTSDSSQAAGNGLVAPDAQELQAKAQKADN
jgi:TatA/E family protein of Tat protein translocase